MIFESEQSGHNRTKQAERAGVFEALGGFVELLQGELGAFEKAVVVDQLAHGPLPLVNLVLPASWHFIHPINLFKQVSYSFLASHFHSR